MNSITKKYLLCAGVLAGLGVLSAGLLAGVNMLTAPVIERNRKAATAAAYKAFNEILGADNESEEIRAYPEGLDHSGIEFFVEAKKGETVVGRIFSVAGRNSYGPIRALIGFNLEGKLIHTSLIENGQTRDGFKDYIDAINADPSKVGILTGFGATYGAGTYYALYAKAQTIAVKLGGGVVIDPAAIATAIYGKADNVASAPVTVANQQMALSYYSVFVDGSRAEEAARIYVGDLRLEEKRMVAAVALSAKGFDGAYVVSYTEADSASHANGTAFAAADLARFEADPLAKRIYDASEAALASFPLITLGEKAKALYQGADAVSAFHELNITFPTRSEANTGTSLIYGYYKVSQADKALGYVYRAKTALSKEENPAEDDYDQVHGSIDFLIGFAGESKDNPRLTAIEVIANSFSLADVLQRNFIDKWNASAVKDFAAFKALAADEKGINQGGIGATYSSHGMVDTLERERQHFATLQEGI